MKGWTMPIQRASYRNVRFEVLSVENSFERVMAEHAYPFVNGADIEDMGLNPHSVRLQAIFYGQEYYTDFKKFLEVLKKQGADTLVHPILGRMPNMICYSASFKHEADYINYVLVDLSFKEATPAKPIFVFENSLLNKIDEYLNKLENFIDDIYAFYGEVMSYVAFAFNVKARLLGAWGAISGIVSQALGLFELGKDFISLPSNVTADNFGLTASKALQGLNHIIKTGTTQSAKVNQLTIKSRFDDVLVNTQAILAIPKNLVSGKNQKERIKSRVTSLTSTDIVEISCALQLLCTANLASVAVEIIESEQEITPNDIEYICTQVKQACLEGILAVRALQTSATNTTDLQQAQTAVYEKAHRVIEQLRDIAAQTTQLAISAINRKPPLIIRTVEISGTLQQVAHHFYQDYQRANELLRLNAHIRHPNFIACGEVLNSYAE
ncbi:DNA circularization protein [Volucribacter amazonae]|uniref:Phage morphogenesis protein n=1 Tax=Volucribacter amazonae TaxID=256731 RepID=A0A9X4PCH4_9PAST|nr:DNA circularization N-terminal domain-containing protein [Volucribacter amazonae]MDG6895036.1 phage morphogenesis protein [Volucribacter amazonae]